MGKFSNSVLFLVSVIIFFACSGKNAQSYEEKILAKVTNVDVLGEEGGYNITVEISSPDKGCEQYADWWEIITEDGKLIYRRIIENPHPDEQPFETSGAVDIKSTAVVIVRTHMSKGGYGTVAFKGSIKTGFQEVRLEQSFAEELEKQAPLPPNCP
jgi:hypothetical protein